MYIGFLWNKHSLWIGAHYSANNKRLCLNLIPCFTIFFVKSGGYIPVRNQQGILYRKKYDGERRYG